MQYVHVQIPSYITYLPLLYNNCVNSNIAKKPNKLTYASSDAHFRDRRKESITEKKKWDYRKRIINQLTLWPAWAYSENPTGIRMEWIDLGASCGV